jgi:hypothetical protein
MGARERTFGGLSSERKACGGNPLDGSNRRKRRLGLMSKPLREVRPGFKLILNMHAVQESAAISEGVAFLREGNNP